jgi:uroporphyrinogen decarboxylase
LFHDLLQSVTTVCCDYARSLAAAGVDAIQIFDSWAGLCPPEIYREASLPWIRQIAAAVDGAAPVILFARGGGHDWRALAGTGVTAVSADWTVDLPALRAQLPPSVAVQGNLDPALLLADAATARRAARSLLAAMDGRRGFIFNLGHGLRPETPPDNVAALVETVAGWRNS